MEAQKGMLELGVNLGQHHAFGLIAGRCSSAQAQTLKRLREDKLYVQCDPIWREFCPKYLGMSSSQADRIISCLDEFGPQFFQLSQLTRISAETYRAIAPAIRDGAIQANGEPIELAPENARQVAAAVAELRRDALEKKPAAVPRERRVGEMLGRFTALVDAVQKLAAAKDFNRRHLADTVHCMSRDLRVLAEKIPA
jgi:hypothetical protein